MEKIAQFPGGEESAESCHVSDCHGSVMSGSRFSDGKSVGFTPWELMNE